MLRNPFLKKNISKIEALKEEAIFNGTSHPINFVKCEGYLIGRGNTLRIAKGRPFEINEIGVNRRLYVREDNIEFDSYYAKFRMPIADFNFGKVSNEESEMYKKIVVSKKYAENIRNVISYIARNYGPYSDFMFEYINQNQFIRKLYVPCDRVLDCNGKFIGCSKLEKAVVLPFENFEWIFGNFICGGNFYKFLTEDEKIFITLEYNYFKNKQLETFGVNQFINTNQIIPIQMYQAFSKREYFIKNILFEDDINFEKIRLNLFV